MSSQDKLILVRLAISQWGIRKYDRQASDEVAKAHGAEDHRSVGRFNKILVKPETIAPVRRAFRELRNRHWFLTAPWADDGVRVMPSAMFFEYQTKHREAKALADAAVAQFVDHDYEAERLAAEKRLGTLFRATDYPTRDRIAQAFDASVRFEPLPNPEDVRVWGIGDVAAAQIQREVAANLEAQIRASHQAVVGDLCARAREFVEKVGRYDSEETGQLRTTALENLRAMVGVVLRGLNVTGDERLGQFAAELDAAIAGVSVDGLREGASLRAKKIAEVDAIASRFAGVFPAARAAR